MPQLTALPPELLTRIVRHADTLYEKDTGLDTFNIMRVGQKLCDIAITVHLKAKDFDRSETITKMFRHERCYVNHARQVERTAKACCETMFADCDACKPLPTCHAGHSQTDHTLGSMIYCSGDKTMNLTFEDDYKFLEEYIKRIELKKEEKKKEKTKERKKKRNKKSRARRS